MLSQCSRKNCVWSTLPLFTEKLTTRISLYILVLLLSLLMAPHHLWAQNQDSRAGDEATLEALYISSNGNNWDNNSGWSSSGMSLSDNIYGVEVASIGGELRVTEIDLRSNNLTGSIDIQEWGNLTELVLVNFAFNFLDTQYPNAIHNCTNLEYLHLNYSDHSLEDPSLHPHEYVATQIPGHLDPGKDSGSGNNIIRGSVDGTVDQLTNLKYFVLNWTDDFGSNARSPNNINGIESVSMDLWNISTLEVVSIYENWNIAHSGNTFSYPNSISHITNLKQVFLGGGTGSTWDEDTEGFMTGTYPSDLGELTGITTWWNERNAELTGFPDLQNSLGLISLIISFTDMTGTLPSWMLDGRFKDLDSFSIGHPTGSGMTGEFPEVSTQMSKLDNFDPVGHDFEGELPEGVWDIDPNKINFGENNLTSIGRTDLTDLSSMSTMRFYRNEIRGERLPKLDWSRGISSLSDQFNRIRFEENRYVFADMLYVPDNAPNGETTFELYNLLNVQRFSYSPQKPFGYPDNRSYAVGTDVTIDDFSTAVTHPDNEYQWQKDGSNISGATSRSLTISNAQSSDSGTYRLIVNNPGVPDLTLSSEEITIDISGSSSDTPPAIPSLASPDDGSTGISTDPVLDWNSSSGAKTYQVQLSTESDFSSFVVDNSGLSATQLQVSDLTLNTNYFWRVRASNSAGDSDWSSVRDFTTEASSGSSNIAAPVQIAPTNSATNTLLSTTFEWEPVENADYYMLHVSGRNPTEMVIETEVDGTTYTPDNALDPLRTHDWRVRAVVDGEQGEWSPIWEFTTGQGYDFELSITGDEGMRMISSPAANKTLDDLLGPLWNQGLEGSDAEQEDPNIFVWNEESQTFEVPSSMSTEIEPGKGYITWVFEDDDPTEDGIQGGFPKQLGFDGTENSSPVTVPVTITDANNSTTIDGQEGWNLIGNPYGVPILVDEILEAARQVNSQVNSNLYVWDHTQSDYLSLPEGEGHTISPFQVFWIRYLVVDEGTITLDKTQLSAHNKRQMPLVNSNTTQLSEQGSITFALEADGGKSDKFSMEFSEKGKIGIDLLDAYKLSSLNPMNLGNSSVELYSIEGEAEEQVSKSVLPDTLTGEWEIQLGFNNPTDGEMTLTWPEFSNIPQDWTIELMDARQNKSVNLKNADSYTFSSTSGQDDSRFTLAISPSDEIYYGSTPQVDKPQTITLQNYPNPFNPSTEIKYTVDREGEVNLTIYNLIGRKIATLVKNNIQDPGTYTVRFNASHLTSGIYIYRLSVDGKVLTKKMTLVK